MLFLASLGKVKRCGVEVCPCNLKIELSRFLENVFTLSLHYLRCYWQRRECCNEREREREASILFRVGCKYISRLRDCLKAFRRRAMYFVRSPKSRVCNMTKVMRNQECKAKNKFFSNRTCWHQFNMDGLCWRRRILQSTLFIYHSWLCLALPTTPLLQ